MTENKEYIGEWVRNRIPDSLPWGSFVAIGLAEDQRLIAAVIYNEHSGANICMHVAAEPKSRWLTRPMLAVWFAYPFKQLGVRRVTALVAKKNKSSRSLCERLGFRLEGCLRHCLKADDLLVYGMLKKECRWVKDN